jgi:hypothetical protein
MAGRPPVKGHASPHPLAWTPSQEAGRPAALERRRQAGRRQRHDRLTALDPYSYQVAPLREADGARQRQAAPGVDGVTWPPDGRDREAKRQAFTAGTGSVPGDGRAPGLQPAARRPPAPVRGARPGRPTCPGCARLALCGPPGGRVPGGGVGMPTRAASPARPGGRAGGPPADTRERETRRGPPRRVRPRVACGAGPVCRASAWGPARQPPHPARADGGGAGRGGGRRVRQGCRRGGSAAPCVRPARAMRRWPAGGTLGGSATHTGR